MNRILLLTLLITLLGCNWTPRNGAPLEAGQRLKYIQAHSGGLQKVDDAIQIVFNSPVSAESKKSKVTYHLQPSHPMEVEWIGDRQLRLIPKKPLDNNQHYELKVFVGPFFADLNDNYYYSIEFFTPAKAQKYESGQLAPTGTTDQMTFEGTITRSGFASTEESKVEVNAVQGMRELKSEIFIMDNGDLKFVIDGIVKEDKLSELKIELRGDDFLDGQKILTYNVPRKNELTLERVQVEPGNDGIFKLHFSNVLDREQDLEGLIKVENCATFRTVIADHFIRVFPSKISNKDLKVKLYPGIKDIHGLQGKQEYSKTVYVGEYRPQVRFVGENKSILVPSEKSHIRFEAIHLKSVIIAIEKIHAHNVLQHLQVNTLDGNYQMDRVGELKSIHRVPLESVAALGVHRWNSYDIDLSAYFEEEPGAIYRINLMFDSQDAVTRCKEDNKGNGLLDESEVVNLEEWYENRNRWYNYNWRERDNPCHASYYRNDRWQSQSFLSSEIGLIAKRDVQGKVYAWVVDLQRGTPVAQAKVFLYNYQQSVLDEGLTDSEGRIVFDGENDESFFLVAEVRKNKTYLKLDVDHALSLSPFDVSGQAVQNGGKGFIYTERGVWRPGDTMYINLMRDMSVYQNGSIPPVIAELYDPNGLKVKRELGGQEVGGIYTFAWPTDKNAITGNWKVVMKMGEAQLSKTLKVETIKPNRLAVKVVVEPTVLYERKPVDLDVTSEWLTGAIHGGGRLEIDRTMTKSPIQFEDYPEFIFHPMYKNWSSPKKTFFDGKTNEKGEATVPLPLISTLQAYSPVKIQLTGRSYEPSGDFSIFSHSFMAHPYKYYAGIRQTKNHGQGLDLNEEQTFEIMAVDHNGSAASGQSLKFMVKSVGWSWWWDRSGRRGNYNYDTDNTVVYTQEVVSQDRPVPVTIPADKLLSGRYMIIVENTSSGHRAAVQVYFRDGERWWYSDEAQESPSMLNFSINQEEFSVGEVIEIEVPTDVGSRLLMSVESGAGILQSAWVQTQSPATTLTLRATPEMMPNCYISFHLIHPMDGKDDQRGLRSFGVKPITVNDNDKLLHPRVDMPKEIEPERELTIKVTELEGKSMAYTLALVDEGLLNLTNFRTPNPEEVFWAHQSLGITTWDHFNDIIGLQTGVGNKVLTVGGDADVIQGNLNDVQRFKPIVRHLGPFFLEEGESQSHHVRLPPYMGNLRAMVVAGYQGKYGHTDANIKVREELMVISTAPRVLTPGDQFELPATIFNMMDESQSVTVDIELEGGVSVVGTKQLNATVEPNDNTTQSFILKAPEIESNARIKLKAVNGKKSSSYTVDIPVRVNSLPVAESFDTSLTSGAAVRWAYEPMGLKNTNDGYLEISRMPALNLEKRTRYLRMYPYQCTEQLTSRIISQVLMEKFVDLTEKERLRIKNEIQMAVREIQMRQAQNGGMKFWPGAHSVGSYVSVYVGHALYILEQEGFGFDATFKQDLVRFLTESSESWNGPVDSNSELTQAYRLYVLSLLGKPAMGAMNRMKSRQFRFVEGRGLLALAYMNAGYQEIGKQIMQRSLDKNEFRGYYRYSRHARRNAVQYYVEKASGRLDRATRMAMEMSKAMGANRYLSTHEIGWYLFALSDFAGSIKSADNQIHVSVRGNGSTTEVKGDDYVMIYDIPEDDVMQELEVVNAGSQPVYIRAVRAGRPLRTVNLTQNQENASMTVKYSHANGNPIDISTTQQGDLINASIQVRLTDEFYERVEDMALTHIVPSGWEIVNDRIIGANSAKDASYNHIDIRDDRVIWHFDMDRKVKTISAQFIATYAGNFYLPPVHLEAMYKDDVFASSKAHLVEVKPN